MADDSAAEQPNDAPETLEQVEVAEAAEEQGAADGQPPTDGQPPAEAQPPDDAQAVEGAGTAPTQPESGGPDPEQAGPAAPPSDDGAGAVEPPAEQPADEQAQAMDNEPAFTWQASEFVHHHKNAAWYLALFAGVAVLVALTALLHSWLEMAAIIVMTGAIVVYASKPPRTLQYELMADGVVIDGRKFPFSDFRSFGVVEDTEWHAVDLEPAKRLRPRMTMLFESDDLPEIVGHLELHLPREDREPDLVEQLTRYLRF